MCKFAFYSLFVLFLTFSMIENSNCAEDLIWEIDSCRITTKENGEFLLCEEEDGCAKEVTGSYVNCTHNRYKPITDIHDCISKCCWDLHPVPEELTGADTKECYDQARERFKRYIIEVVFITIASVTVVVTIVGLCIFGYVRNPYTGKRVFVGCCCCKKVPDFEEDRAKIESNENIGRTDSEKEMKNTPLDENRKKIRTETK